MSELFTHSDGQARNMDGQAFKAGSQASSAADQDGQACGTAAQDGQAGQPRKVAVFDFDGTCIDGNSPVILVRHLTFKNMLPKSVVLKIIGWALRYKFKLPQDESWVRGLVFSAFAGKPVEQVDKFLYDFYDQEIEGRFHPEADATMQQLKDEGCVVLIVSATFEPIVIQASKTHAFTAQVSTRMKINPDQTYSCEVDGLPVEGQEKVNAITRWCNEHLGEGNWVIEYAYGDHHSDTPMLEMAAHAVAVDPDRTLARVARARSWNIIKW